MYVLQQVKSKSNEDLLKGFIPTFAILSSPCAFNIRAGYISLWLQNLKHKASLRLTQKHSNY